MGPAVDDMKRVPFPRLTWKKTIVRAICPRQRFKNWSQHLRRKRGFHAFFAMVVMKRLQQVNHFMERAVALSLKNVRAGSGGPFAALVVRHGSVIAEGTNQVTAALDPTAHAEVVAIRKACQAIGNFQLSDCELYTTCEPCPMCMGAIYWARFARVYYGNTRADAAKIGFDDSFIYDQLVLPLDARKIPMIPLMREQALAAFREWEHSQTKTKY